MLPRGYEGVAQAGPPDEPEEDDRHVTMALAMSHTLRTGLTGNTRDEVVTVDALGPGRRSGRMKDEGCAARRWKSSVRPGSSVQTGGYGCLLDDSVPLVRVPGGGFARVSTRISVGVLPRRFSGPERPIPAPQGPERSPES